MIADFHMHSAFSSDSEAAMEAMVGRGAACGMDIVCLTDHYDKDYGTGEFQLDTERYVAEVERVKEMYRGRISVRLGVELGLQVHLREWLTSYVKEYPFDFVIGSMHLLHGKDPYYQEQFQGTDEAEQIREYFRETVKNLDEFHGFQSLGHMDYLTRYLRQTRDVFSYRMFADEIDEILGRLIRYQIALEVNTAGYKYGMGRPNPGSDVIKRYRELGGELLTVGADAHRPEHVGYGFDQARALLESCGIRYYTVYKMRKPYFIKI